MFILYETFLNQGGDYVMQQPIGLLAVIDPIDKAYLHTYKLTSFAVLYLSLRTV